MNNKNDQELCYILQNLSDQLRFQKALRHFNDALQSRPPDHRFQLSNNKAFLFAYIINNSNFYQYLVVIMNMFYMVISFWQASNDNQTFLLQYYWVIGMEWFILCFLLFDLFVRFVFQLSHTRYNSPRINYAKLAVLSISIIILWSDAITFHVKNIHFVRYGRVFRAVISFIYVKFYYRLLVSLVSSYQEMLILVLFFLSIVATFAFLCVELFNFQGFQPQDNQGLNYTNFFRMLLNMYVLHTFDGYPSFGQSSLRYGNYFILYFIFQMGLFLIFFVVIPTSLIYLAFKSTFSQYFFDDDLNQKQNLLIAFSCIDFQSKQSITYKQFSQFMIEVYKKDSNYKYRIYELFQLIKDPNSNKKLITVNEFINIIGFIQKFPRFQPPFLPNIPFIYKARKYLNKKLSLKMVVSNQLQFFMSAVVIIHCILILVQASDVLIYITQLFFLLQCLLKLLGLGIDEYMVIDWNKLDLGLILIDVVFFILNTSGYYFVHVKNSINLMRVFRIVKIFKIFKSFKWWRTLSQNLSFIDIVWRVVSRMLISLGIMLKIMSIYIPIFYIYAVIGNQTWSFLPFQKPSDDYGYNTYSQYFYQSFQGYMIIFFQVIVESGWSAQLFYLQEAFQQNLLPTLYFISLHFISVLLILSVTKGVSWQIYLTVDKQIIALQKNYNISQKLQHEKLLQLSSLAIQIEEGGKLTFQEYLAYERLLGKNLLEQKLGEKGKNSCLHIMVYDGRRNYKNSRDQQFQFYRECCIRWYCKKKLREGRGRSDKSMQQHLRKIIQNEFIEMEGQKQEDQNITQEYIIKQNMLKDINPELLAIYEVNNLMEVFKSDFQQLHEVDIVPILNYQFITMNSLRCLLRIKRLSNDQFFQILNVLQANINKVLLNEGSLFKIFFQYEIDHGSMYQFCLRSVDGQAHLTPLTKKFWIKLTSTQEYDMIQDVFSVPKENRNEKIVPNVMLQRIINNLYKSLLSMNCSLNKGSQSFHAHDPNQSIYNMYSLNIQSEKQQRGITVKCVLLQRLAERLTPLQFKIGYPIKSQKIQKDEIEQLLNKDNVGLQDKIGRQGLPQRMIRQFLLSLREVLMINKQQLFSRLHSKFSQGYQETVMEDTD